MTNRIAFALLCIALALPTTSQAGDLWAFAGSDASVGTVSAFGYRENYTSYAGDFSLQYEWAGSRYFPQGISVGIRKETLSLSNGTYLTLRTSWRGRQPRHGFLVIGTIGVVYGWPGTQFDRTTETLSGDGTLVRTHLYAKATVPIPLMEIRQSGVIIPEWSVSARKTLHAGRHRFHLEPTLSVRMFKIGVVRANGISVDSAQKRCPMVSLGIRIGFDYQSK